MAKKLKKISKQKYIVISDIATSKKTYKKGDPIELSDIQAKFYRNTNKIQ